MTIPRLDLGILAVGAKTVEAFEGYKGRVFAKARDALIDQATNELATLWLQKCGTGGPTFAAFMQCVEVDPALTEAAVKLARFKAAQ